MPASGSCWADAFVFANWGNLICAHEEAALAIFRRFVPATPSMLLRGYTYRPPHFKCMPKALMVNASIAVPRACQDCLTVT